MTKVLIIEQSENMIVTLEQELQKIIPDTNIIGSDNYKQGIKYILKYGSEINLILLNYSVLDEKDNTLLDMAESNNIKCIVLCEDINSIPKDIVFEKDCIIDCIINYGKSAIKNIINSANRILKNIDKHVLVVEDSKIQLALLTKILLKMNLNVTTAQNGEEALEKLQNNSKKFGMILTDYNMPKMDGMQLTLKVREEFDKDEICIIILSSNNHPEIASQFLKMGANDFINKPYNETEVLTRINSNLDLIELFSKTKEIANKDYLTGAYNRRYFFETANLILKKSKRNNNHIAIAMIDIDKFKDINDTYGHDCGDKVICDVVMVLNQQLRESDLMARFGGEEFCVILDNVSLEDSSLIFEKIRNSFEKHSSSIGDELINCTVSIGVYYGFDNSLEEMIKKADESLYYCKENGRNQIKVSS